MVESRSGLPTVSSSFLFFSSPLPKTLNSDPLVLFFRQTTEILNLVSIPLWHPKLSNTSSNLFVWDVITPIISSGLIRVYVAQVADVVGGRTVPMNEEQKVEAEKTVVGEFSDVKHVRGILSMGRYADPNSAASSFSMLLGDAPHLDGQYAIFGKVTKGDETLRKLEQLPTRREGIFVMPTERITILSTYYYGENRIASLFSNTKLETCEQEKSVLKRRLAASAVEVE
ncbi:Peptidyl-prolyl cis-trans isomerase CYP23 [Camellia lanceoleosa]|uniref:Peptidyl-prolyl cis-trans isomerase CYP23 n=1 Tax=Camellia lanceoleosa TaxID=1840588 RepID=A0ACC0I9S5_9ERIC|nr:Peptidyl-prolyl cis-trans isomerase CYP23 [Camellia lanceoleosa]